ncbi:LOW QUALITY PROTEIN: hypothetical protein PHMEG_00019157 [Phytophthora megakarya]|uniref:Uncharacterized protein n=1 Tax=Phytophthora megakarya TaxID=4795 RepID=A0A225VU37_9STRA|nr:LOW QUALITY PROTEIN: hypothetical protein PHMEG_00019157 [Phytophthora megakarya]
MLPPKDLDNRSTKPHFIFMVSALVLLLNERWWEHAGSRFKTAHTIASSTACQHQFPRDRVPSCKYLIVTQALPPRIQSRIGWQGWLTTYPTDSKWLVLLQHPIYSVDRAHTRSFDAKIYNYSALFPNSWVIIPIRVTWLPNCVGNAVEQSRVYRSVAALNDYVHRPVKLCSIHLYTFHIKYFRRKRTSRTSNEVFHSDGHPLCGTHSLGVHARDVVSVTIGQRMSYVNELSPGEIKALQAKIALVLFKPFRSIQDLIQSPTHQTWIGLTLTHSGNNAALLLIKQKWQIWMTISCVEVKPPLGAIDMVHKIGPTPIPKTLQTNIKSLR